jgi:PAS domain-containing protein
MEGDEASSPDCKVAVGTCSLGDDPRAMATLFRQLLARSDDVFSVFDRDGRVLYMSPSVERLLGWPAQDLIGACALHAARFSRLPRARAARARAARR